MDIHQKVENLGQAAALDCEGPPALTREERKAQFLDQSRVYVTHPQRGKIPVLRTMQTSACERNCYYCPFQAGRDYRRVAFKPEELASAFDEMQRKKLVDGLFLSSGIIGGGVKAMGPMLDTVEIVRRKYEYYGYIHLKIMPGAEAAQIERAARLADRLSINLEAANEQRLTALAPRKNFWQELLPPLYWVRQNQHVLGPWIKTPSLTTQFVVGPAGESDHELLTTAQTLYRQANLARAYYSPFNPIRGTVLEDAPKTPPLREHRLYQADWLLRFYGFEVSELPFDPQGHLPLTSDPKLVWAKTHLNQRPIEINRASRAELLRIPGIGPKTAEAIIAARRVERLSDLSQLKQLGVQTSRAAPFILLNGRQAEYQLQLVGF
ncbi:MAG: radical SAM protein [Anaerolineales bacterium]|nr:radical SAM protein [Anaerolineales bacterium]